MAFEGLARDDGRTRRERDDPDGGDTMTRRNFGAARIAVGAAAALLLAWGVASAQTGPADSDGSPRGQDLERWGRGLDLTDEQLARIAEIREEGRDAQRDLALDLARVRNELEGELMKDEPDAERVQQLVDRSGELRTQMQKNRLEHQLAVRKLLTPAQRDQLLLRRAARCDGRGLEGRRGHGRDHRPGLHGKRGCGDSFDCGHPWCDGSRMERGERPRSGRARRGGGD
jgi:Spy/CpxP family protein refolding chaperone